MAGWETLHPIVVSLGLAAHAGLPVGKHQCIVLEAD
jgi:hypothetical protein